jgi:hypothetical protein
MRAALDALILASCRYRFLLVKERGRGVDLECFSVKARRAWCFLMRLINPDGTVSTPANRLGLYKGESVTAAPFPVPHLQFFGCCRYLALL